MNTNLLKSHIVKHGETQESVAALLGITRSTLSKKMRNNDADFTQREIMVIKEHFNLTADDIDGIFFDEKVS